jgi:hypothetical protein
MINISLLSYRAISPIIGQSPIRWEVPMADVALKRVEEQTSLEGVIKGEVAQ